MTYPCAAITASCPIRDADASSIKSTETFCRSSSETFRNTRSSSRYTARQTDSPINFPCRLFSGTGCKSTRRVLRICSIRRRMLFSYSDLFFSNCSLFFFLCCAASHSCLADSPRSGSCRNFSPLVKWSPHVLWHPVHSI